MIDGNQVKNIDKEISLEGGRGWGAGGGLEGKEGGVACDGWE